MLIIAILTTPYERLHRTVYMHFLVNKIAVTGTKEDLSEIGSTTFRIRAIPVEMVERQIRLFNVVKVY